MIPTSLKGQFSVCSMWSGGFSSSCVLDHDCLPKTLQIMFVGIHLILSFEVDRQKLPTFIRWMWKQPYSVLHIYLSTHFWVQGDLKVRLYLKCISSCCSKRTHSKVWEVWSCHHKEQRDMMFVQMGIEAQTFRLIKASMVLHWLQLRRCKQQEWEGFLFLSPPPFMANTFLKNISTTNHINVHILTAKHMCYSLENVSQLNF